MRVAVVGGGVSGSAAALWLTGHGHEVALYETAPSLGGILRDLVTPHGRFFQGCQYINLDSPLMELVSSLGDLELQVFPHLYGSWNNLFGEAVVHHDFAQVVVPGAMGAAPAADVPVLNAAQRLAAYEPRVSTALTGWAECFGPLEQLEADNCGPMQLGRVFYRDASDAVQQAKHSHALADRLLGLPRSAFSPAQPVQSAALPRGGYDAFFDRIEAALRARGTSIHFRSPIKPVLANNQAVFLLRGEVINADAVVWCCNPTPLLLKLVGQRLDAPSTPCLNLLATVDGVLPAEPVYYQIFGVDHPLLRVFAYELDGPRLTVEALDVGWSLDRLVDATHQVLQDIGWSARVHSATLVPQLRYTLVTCADRQRFERFEESAVPLRLVPGGWQHYGRDPRLASVLGALQRMTVS